MKVINNTKLDLAILADLPKLGTYRNEWRQRMVTLYRLAPGRVVSYGLAFDASLVIICDESDELHAGALAAFAAGRSFTFK
jgi:hypothetical protein